MFKRVRSFFAAVANVAELQRRIVELETDVEFLERGLGELENADHTIDQRVDDLEIDLHNGLSELERGIDELDSQMR